MTANELERIRMINEGTKIDDAFAEYLAYLISRSITKRRIADA